MAIWFVFLVALFAVERIWWLAAIMVVDALACADSARRARQWQHQSDVV